MGKHYKPRNKKIVVLSIIRILFFIASVVSIIYIVKWYIDSKQNEILEEKVSEAIVIEDTENKEANDEYKIDFVRLNELNEQVVAWIKVKGTQVEYPVVQANNNYYYLKRNLEKQYNVGGWIFADYKNKLDGTDKNLVVYGHNMKDNSMFGTLKNILKEEWYNNNENHIIDFITENEEQKYQVFSVYKIESEDYYINTEFKENEFEKFADTLKNRSIKDFGVEISEEDSILTLSTCAESNKYRVVLHAKRIFNH